MAEAFDTGPLSWVKDEIDQSLKKVLASFTKVAEKPEDFASLRFTEAHLYQVSGALDMVGLEGCKRYCAEIEKLTSKLEKQQIPVTNEVMASLMFAVETLGQYLQDLLNGSLDMPIRLFDSLKPLVELQNQTIEESELFFPDTSFSAPKDLPRNPIEESAIPIFVADQRASFQKHLLDWLRTNDSQALNHMHDAVNNVQQVQQKNAQKTVLWVASAFTDALGQQHIAAHSGAKKLCRRLDQYLRSMSLGEAKIPPQLLRDLLYFIALSNRSSDSINKVKDHFELDALLPTQQTTEFVATSAERAALALINSELPSLKDLWSDISAGKVSELSNFITKFESLAAIDQKLNNQIAAKLFATMHTYALSLEGDKAKLNEVSLIELAASLNLLEYITEYYQQLDVEAQQKIITQTKRLQSLLDGEELESAADAFATGNLDASVVEAVAKQIIESLQKVEKALDTFFRDTANVEVLAEVVKPIEQVSAAFDMLEMPVPKTIAKLSAQYAEHFRNNATKFDQSQFELVAESLSMLGLFAEELPNVRAESKTALSEALHRLEASIADLNVIDLKIDGTLADELQALDEEVAQPELDALSEADVVKLDALLQGVDLKLGEEADAATPIINDETTKLANTTAKNVIEATDLTVSDRHILADAQISESVTDLALDAELEDIFIVEAEEVIASLAQNLQALRVNETDSEALADVRRAYHTLKGSGRTVGLTGMGEVAWSVEKMLNFVIEQKAFPSAKQIAFIEEVTAAFAAWVADLQSEKSVTLNPTLYQLRAAELEKDASTVSAKPKSEEVLIDGTHKLSRAFFNIFIAEAQQHLETLIAAQKAIHVNDAEMPSEASYRAAHTLGSNALTAGFNPIGELARALENWLDAHTSTWTEQHITLYGNVIKALEDGLEKAKAYKNAKTTRALVNALSESTTAMQAAASEQAEAAVLETAAKSLDHEAIAPIEIEISAATLGDFDADAALTATPDAPAIEAKAKASKAKVTAKKSTVKELNKETENAAEVSIAKSTIEPKEILPESVVAAKTLAENSVDQELLALFIEEARELVPQVGKDLRGWRANPQEADYPDSLQRALHTLKGSARMAGQSSLGDSVHNMEDRVIRALKHKVSLDDFDEMFVEFDRIGYMLEDISGNTKITNIVADQTLKAVAAPTRSTDRKSQFLRMRADVLDRLINEAGEVSIMRSRMDREMQNFKQSSIDLTESITRLRTYLREVEIEAETQLQSRLSLLQEANEQFDPLEFDRFTRLQELTRMMAESVNDVATIQHGLLLNLDQTDAALQQQNRMNRELQQGLMSVRMLPFATISERLQRIVRQTARELNKRVEMTIEGETIEIDRGVLDKMGAPLEHLLRNAVAHGLETTEQRIELGKSEAGHIKLKISVENDEITLVITDDGSGVNLAKVKQKALDKGLFAADQDITDQALMAVIFEPGFSTADTISQIAGRGVGLDAVRSDIATLGGRIDVSNVAGMGAMFNIYLPVTLSVAQVVMVRAGAKMFAIPSVMVEQVQKLKTNDLTNAYLAHKIEWATRDYPLHFLSKLIGDVDNAAQHHTYTPIILLRSGTYRTAVHVDEIIGNQEVVMKPMGTQLSRVPGMIGATVLGDGAIVLVINPVQLANREALSVGTVKISTAAPVVELTKRVALVVDDSLTMRKVLSRLLEREDFEVVTANDGMDAIQKLQLHQPDIILTDIEMPRMDGFEFSRHVRDTPKTANTPLIMISSRTAEKHRNVAAELGVNAFLGKPVQDEELMNQVNALLKKTLH